MLKALVTAAYMWACAYTQVGWGPLHGIPDPFAVPENPFASFPIKSESEPVHVKPVVPAGEHYVPVFKLNEQVNETSTGRLIKQINWANEDGAKDIVIEINSPGGYVDDGFKLARVIEESEAHVHCVVEGDAASMAFYLLQSCYDRSMTSRSRLMVHEPSRVEPMSGQPDQWLNRYLQIKTLSRGMAQHYAKRMGMPVWKVERKIAGGKEWWMNEHEAMRYNAIDFVADGVKRLADRYRKGPA